MDKQQSKEITIVIIIIVSAFKRRRRRRSLVGLCTRKALVNETSSQSIGPRIDRCGLVVGDQSTVVVVVATPAAAD